MRTERAQRLLDHERAYLQALRIGLVRDLELEAASLACELSTIDQHLADQATDTLDREVEASVLASVDAALAEVDDARVRLGRGTYGTCVVCGTAIPDERLEAAPTARTCVEHELMGPDASASRSASVAGEALRHLDLLVDDGDGDDGQCAEEAAMHVEPTSRT